MPHRFPCPAVAAAVVFALLVPACGRAPRGAAETASAPSGGGSTAGARFMAPGAGALLPRPPATRHRFPLSGGGQGPVVIERAFPNLTFTDPLDVAAPDDGSDRVFVATKSGRIHVFPNRDDVTGSTVFLDISSRVWDWFEIGFLGFCFDPDYRSNGFFYVHYVDRAKDSHITQFRVSANDRNRADTGYERELLRVRQPAPNHNGGCLQFGPDGMLYIAFGDGGGQHDEYGHAQNLATLFGCMLRIDPHGSNGPGGRYGIPADNPYVGVAGADEAWAHGLRSPWRFAFDEVTGELWLGDVGQDRYEEIDRIRRGGNYGWPHFEGDAEHRNPNNLPRSRFDFPVFWDSRPDMRSVIGGRVYRGSAVPALHGRYLFGDYDSGSVFALRQQGGQVSKERIGSVPHVVSFGTDEAGELLIVSLDGSLHRLAQGAGGAGFPELLTGTGLLDDVRALAWDQGLIGYRVNSELWSDHATKTRLFSVPDGAHIGYRADDGWDFPVGSVLVKHFELEMERGNPGTSRRLETRVMVRQVSGWAGATYRWNATQDDARLVSGRASETFSVRDATAETGARQQTWTFPEPSDCRQCHTQAAGHVLGLSTLQTNDLVPGAPPDGRSQLWRWRAMGLFDRALPDLVSLPRLHGLEELEVPVAQRARAYLHANCAHCHRPGGAMQGMVDMRYGTVDAAMGLLDVRPTRGDLGLTDPWRVRRGDPRRSVLWLRMQRLDGLRMPALGSAVVHHAAAVRLAEWISGL